MGELENERINRLENGVNANNTRKTRNANNTTKGNRQVELFGRVGQVREGGWRIRKITEKFKRRLRGFLMKKGCKESGVSL